MGKHEPINICPRCKGALEADARFSAELVVFYETNRRVLGTRRNFRGQCARCGLVMPQRSGHHATFLEKALTKLFSRDHRERVLLVVSIEEGRQFKRALAGRIAARPEDLARWIACARPRASLGQRA